MVPAKRFVSRDKSSRLNVTRLSLQHKTRSRPRKRGDGNVSSIGYAALPPNLTTIWIAELPLSRSTSLISQKSRTGRNGALCRLAEEVIRAGTRQRASASLSVARRTEKQSSPENTRWTVRPSRLIHFVGRQDVSPGPTSHCGVKTTVVHGPHGSGAS